MGADADDDFPRHVPIKVLGRNVPEFRAVVLAIVHAHWPDEADFVIAERSSSGGAYLSFTITARVADRAAADAVYRDLSGHEQILMVL
jgi:hypothetical protein